jgi:hypothetical protein
LNRSLTFTLSNIFLNIEFSFILTSIYHSLMSISTTSSIWACVIDNRNKISNSSHKLKLVSMLSPYLSPLLENVSLTLIIINMCKLRFLKFQVTHMSMRKNIVNLHMRSRDIHSVYYLICRKNMHSLRIINISSKIKLNKCYLAGFILTF